MAAEYAKSTDVSSNIATAKQEAINSAKTEALNAVASEYAKSTDVSSNIATAKQEAINSAKTEALNAVASEYAKSTDVSSSIATAKQEAINSAKTEAQQYADRTFATTQTVQNLKVSDLDGSDKLVQKSDKLDAVMGKFDDSGNLSEGFKTEVANAVSDKGFVTETNLNAKLGETASFQQMYNALSSKGLITKTESGEIVATDETPGN